MSSTIPAVLDGLVAAFRANPVLADVQVVDGEPAGGLDGPTVLVGYDGETATVEADRAAHLTGGRETYTIPSMIWVWTGATDPAPVRTRAFELLTAVEAHLTTDPTVGGAASRAHLTVVDFGQSQTPDGATVGLRFAIHVDAFVR